MKKTEDINLIASRIVAELADLSKNQKSEKNPNAVALGRLGGLKGGKARAKKLSLERRKEIAREAALARWKIKKERVPIKT